MERLLSVLIGYCFGCILTAEIVCRGFTGKNIREIGTGNPGMANVMANVGKLPGALVLVGDIAKTAAAMGLCWMLFSKGIGMVVVHYAGLGALLGHNFPIWRKFRGGKGVAVTCTWLILGFGLPGVLCCLLGAAVVFLTGWLPLGAVVITAAAVPVAFWYGCVNPGTLLFLSGTGTKAGIQTMPGMGAEVGILAVISLILMISRHYRGLGRILKGEEETHLKLRKK